VPFDGGMLSIPRTKLYDPDLKWSRSTGGSPPIAKIEGNGRSGSTVSGFR